MSRTYSLDGVWGLSGFDEGQGDWARAQAPYPVDASVPGEVHPALEAAGVIPDPFYGEQSADVQWVESKEWWYRRTFTLPPGFLQRRAYLEFDGLDTLATVYLNGALVGESANMLIAHRFDVTGRLRAEGENVVEVIFLPVAKTLGRMNLDKGYYVRYARERIGARKMQASFGWDWNPRLLGAGIWRSARVVTEADLAIEDVHIRPQCGDGVPRADVTVDIANHTGKAVDTRIEVRIRLEDTVAEVSRDVVVSACGQRIRLMVDVPDAALWWPNGLGPQTLYTAEVALREGGTPMDACEVRFGFRTVEVRERDEAGRPAFHVWVNGRRLFIKGANWIPSDSFPSRISKGKYERLLTMVRDAHMNMLRVWGGGSYEHDTFYRLCDELGILVWQDFMYALADYPDDDGFVGNALHETEAVIRRLRNHPCVAVWCGNSECELDKEVDAPWFGKRLFHKLIPQAARDLDGTRPVWYSSPFGGDVAASPDHGTCHREPWFDLVRQGPETWEHQIANSRGLFMAEFPTQGVPSVETLRRFIPEEDLWPPQGPVWEHHAQNNQHRQGNMGVTSLEALARNIRGTMGDADNLEQWARKGGILQGLFLQSQIEYYRRHKFAVGGAMLWMFNDAWPAVDYSVVDYYALPKPAYYFVRRAYAPVLLCMGRHEEGVAAWVVNDLPSGCRGRLRVAFLDAGGDTLRIEKADVRVEGNAVAQVWSGPQSSQPRRQWWIATLESEGEVLGRAVYTPALPKDVDWPAPALYMDVAHHADIAEVRLSSQGFARWVSIEGLPETARPDDNHFDLFPGESRIIRIHDMPLAWLDTLRIVVG